MSSGTQPTQTTNTQQVLSPEQRQMMAYAMPGVEQFAASVPQRYPGQTLAGFDPLQTQGQEMLLNASQGQGQLGQGALNTSNFWLSNNPWDPANNPNLQGAIDAAVRPITENYNQVVRPAIRDEFVGANQFGGSERAGAEGIAANQYMRNVGDTSAKLANAAYGTNVDAQLKALGLLPQTQSSLLQPGITASNVGDVRQAMTQLGLNQNVANYNYDQLAPFLQSQEIMSLLQGMPGGGTTSTSTGNTPNPNMAMSTLGGAASGAALGSMFMPGPGTAVGAGMGALLPWITR